MIRIGGEPARSLGQRHPRDRLEFLRDLARDHERPVAVEHLGEVRDRGADAMRRLVQHERHRQFARRSRAARVALSRPPAGSPGTGNRSAASPAVETAAIAAFAPGIGTTGKPASRTARTSRAPGSLTAGVPASLTSATLRPAFSMPTISSARAASLCSCKRKRARRDAVVPQQHRRHARILGGDDVGAAEHVECAQRHVTQISDRRGDHI